MGGEKMGEAGGHAGVPGSDQPQKNEQPAPGQDRPEPGSPTRDKDRRQRGHAQRPQGAVQPLAQGAEGQESPEEEIPVIARKTSPQETGLRNGWLGKPARLDQAPDGQRGKTGQE